MLVVTADDLGLSPGVNRGVLTAYRDGIVRSTSLIVTTPAAAEGAAMAREEPGLEIGLHLDLVEGGPVSGPDRVPTLVGRDGRFLGLGSFVSRLWTGRIRANEIALEIRAQAARARELGVPPLAWDSHRHTHLIPLVARVVGPIAREEGARWLRRTGAPRVTPSWKPALLSAASSASELFFRRLPGNDWYVDLTSRRPRPDAAWVALLAAYRGRGEISAHPAVGVDTADGIARARPQDLGLLTDPLLRRAFGDDSVGWRVTPS